MNIYFWGMCISMVIYLAIGVVISKKVKNVDDYFVAGRQAPVALIAGSMIASYASTSLFMGDAAECYEGAFSSLIILSTMQVAGYILGAVFFGRYLRRSKVLTIPEFFGRRFASPKVHKLSAVTAIITMCVYLIAVSQGIGTLMSVVTNVDYKICVVLALAVVTIVTVMSGSRGVLITDTLMASVFTVALLLAAAFISGNAGGWFESIEKLATNPDTTLLLAWSGKPGAVYDSGFHNVAWGVVYGIVWLSVCMVGPWQSSRYLMAKNEHTVVRSSFIAAFGIFMVEFLAGMSAVMVNLKNPALENSAHVLIYAAMNMMPKVLGVILLTGVLAAGISSGTTFLSLVGASIANDVVKANGNKAIKVGKIAMLFVAGIVCAFVLINPPAIFWITFFGGAIVASSWMPVVVAGIFSKRLTKTGAFCGMLAGFIACFVIKLYASLSGTMLPFYLDPSVVGMVVNVVFMIIGSMLTQVQEDEKKAREDLFVMPEEEKDQCEMKKTLKITKMSVALGVLVSILLLLLWVIPYKMV